MGLFFWFEGLKTFAKGVVSLMISSYLKVDYFKKMLKGTDQGQA